MKQLLPPRDGILVPQLRRAEERRGSTRTRLHIVGLLKQLAKGPHFHTLTDCTPKSNTSAWSLLEEIAWNEWKTFLDHLSLRRVKGL